mmetsp:Transcript_85564/g.238857  ORF Transcript_85564/g.238857 Transcript_85564/m.238857 type:complete len:223 (-) Transcript_85564:41-709(-)
MAKLLEVASHADRKVVGRGKAHCHLVPELAPKPSPRLAKRGHEDPITEARPGVRVQPHDVRAGHWPVLLSESVASEHLDLGCDQARVVLAHRHSVSKPPPIRLASLAPWRKSRRRHSRPDKLAEGCAAGTPVMLEPQETASSVPVLFGSGPFRSQRSRDVPQPPRREPIPVDRLVAVDPTVLQLWPGPAGAFLQCARCHQHHGHGGWDRPPVEQRCERLHDT